MVDLKKRFCPTYCPTYEFRIGKRLENGRLHFAMVVKGRIHGSSAYIGRDQAQQMVDRLCKEFNIEPALS